MELLTTPAAAYTPPETAIVHAAEASLTQRGVPSVVHLVQYDQTMPILAVRLSSNGAPYAVPSGAAVNFRAAKPDGTHVYNPALGLSADRGTAYVSVTKQTAAAAGTLRAVIEIVLSGAVAATARFAAEIDQNPVPQDAIESIDEYKTVYELLAETQAAASAAKASETAAAGSAAGAATSAAAASASETVAAASAASASASADAAKESETASASSATESAESAEAASGSAEAARGYAEQAQQVSQGAVGYYETHEALKAAHPTAEAGNWAIVGSTDTIWVWDTDGSEWLDTGQNVNLADYYTKEQTDAQIDAARGTAYTIDVPAAGWTGAAAPYTNTVSVEGMTAQTILDCMQLASPLVGNDAAEQAYAQWSYLDTKAGAVTLTAEETKPAADFTIWARSTERMQSVNDLIDTDALKAEILSEIGFANNAGAHNAIYRGKALGGGVTDQQYAAIAAGTFDDLYIGDYWTINGINWRIAAFDYYLRTGDTEMTEHHAVIVPDSNLYNAKMNETNTTDGGYVGSNMYTSGLDQAKTTIHAAFSGHVLTHRVYRTNAVANGIPSGGAWYDSEVDLMNEQMVYGGAIFMPVSDGMTIPRNYRVEKSQLPLFAYSPSNISNGMSLWLHDVVSNNQFSCVTSRGTAVSNLSSSNNGVRPAFCIG